MSDEGGGDVAPGGPPLLAPPGGGMLSPTSGTPNLNVPAGALAYNLEPFADPNSKPFRLAIPMRGGNKGTVSASIVLGDWGSTVYKVYPSADGTLPLAATALATINTSTRYAEFDCTAPYFIVDLDTAAGSSGYLHRIEGTAVRTP